MAFGEIKNTEVSVQSFTRYIGIMPVKVLAVNPNKKELTEIYGREFTEEPNYLGEVEYEHPVTKQVSKVKTVRVEFIVANEELDFKGKVSFYLTDTPWISTSGKCKVIDKYGRTAWVTAEQFQNKEIPQYANGPANISSDYTPCMRNQEELIEFLKYYFGIPEVMRYDNGTWVEVDDTTSCEVYLEKIKDYFKGDVSEIKNAIATATANKIKVLVGIKMTNGNTYQDIYTGKFMRNNAVSTKQLEKSVKDTQTAGGYANTLFNVGEVTVWDGSHPNVAEAAPTVANPFASSASPAAPATPNTNLPF